MNFMKQNTKGVARLGMVLFAFFTISCSPKVIVSPVSELEKNFHILEDDNNRLHYVSVGSKYNPPILFIHGAPGNWRAYENFLADKALQNDFHMISVDRLGYGASRKGKPSLASIDEQAKLIVKALKANLSGEKAIIIGRSYGAPIAAKITAQNPDIIEKLLLISPVINPDKEKYFWFAYAAKHWVVSQFLPSDYNIATKEKFAHAAELRKMEEDWANIETDVTVFQGGEDWISDIANFDYAKRQLRKLEKKERSHFVFLPKAGHSISETHPEVVKKAIFRKKSTTEVEL